jgi:hypothetical protein
MIRTTLCVILTFCASLVSAQPRFITETQQLKREPGFARDFWFSMIENYELQQGGKYYEMYVTSDRETDIYIGIGNATPNHFPISAREVLTYRIPLAWEPTSSGEIRDNGIHVWSKDADLTVHVMSRNPATSDGMFVLPTSSLGKEYVVAAFHSYAYLPGYDLPSEFAIVATEDETTVTITPSTDLRHGQNTQVFYKRKEPFTITLQRGQAVQYQASAANGNMKDYDVTGTTISSTKPVAVVGGVMCANVPADAPYCDHICDMILPVDKWGRTYYSVPFTLRKGGDTFLVFKSDPDQRIIRKAAGDTAAHVNLTDAMHWYVHDIDKPSRWSSDKPFMLVQYCNGTDWPESGANNGIGDPSMMVINPLENFKRRVVFQTPSSSGTPFTNYINVIVHKNAVPNTLYNGKPISNEMQGLSPTFDDNYVAFFRKNAPKGTAVIESDSGIGVQVYGYGSYDSYAWPGDLGKPEEVSAADTSTPYLSSVSEDCYQLTVRVAESKLAATSNLQFSEDSLTNASINDLLFLGSSHDSIMYRFSPRDSSRNAFAQVRITDEAGNGISLQHTYKVDTRLPVALNGAVKLRIPAATDASFYIPLRSPASNVYAYSLGLTTNEVSLSENSITLYPQETDSVQVNFVYDRRTRPHRDTLVVSDECSSMKVPIEIRTFGFDLSEDTVHFGFVKPGTSLMKKFSLRNLGSEAVTITDLQLIGEIAFTLSQVQLPFTVPGGADFELRAEFAPTAERTYDARLFAQSSDETHSLVLVGTGVEQLSVDRETVPSAQLRLSPNPAANRLTVKVEGAEGWTGGEVRILDLQGKLWLGPIQFTAQTNELDLSDLPSGSYNLEVWTDDGILREKLTILR